MKSEDLINLPASTHSGSQCENNELGNQGGLNEADSLLDMELSDGDVGNENTQFLLETDQDKGLIESSSNVEVSVASTEIVTLPEELNAESGCLDAQNGSPICKHVRDNKSISGVKRAWMTIDDEQPSVHVKYNYLTRASKQKLEQLLQKWSEWQAKHGSSSKDPNEFLESGEETYFPAIQVGVKKTSAVSFWIDNQTTNEQNKAFIPLDGNSVPSYDRGYALGLTSADNPSNLEGGLEILDDASRCFNCGSYSHSLKECLKPRDNNAVNSARKHHKSKRNQNSGSRNSTRYYQSSLGGKYDDLTPGSLSAETRKLMGLGELDPPPWLNRMRELGYPPGYLDPDNEDQPSGITIFADEEIKEELAYGEDGEIVETNHSATRRKETIEFPGINAAIPEKADEKQWAARPLSSDSSLSRSHHRLDHSLETISRGHLRENWWSGELRDDGPPGVDPVHSPSMSSYPPRWSYDSSNFSGTSSFGRSQSDRGRWSPLVYEDFVSHDSYSSPSYRSLIKRGSSQDHGNESWDDYDREHSSWRMHKYDGYRHLSRR
ncbi:PSP domain-containing protein [Cephalotus follicularis]|uniref:PSP domain-containing protein n=1 Tax=Cephalotus follicularis TaxID=3775 RepID=A0A1Q3BSW5_CEPFO|nr:PSP domain-containing protein [Cephalotus follicularis]